MAGLAFVLHPLLRRLAPLAACLALCADPASAGGRVLLGGPEWQPAAELCAALRPAAKEEPRLLVLAFGELRACEWPGWRVEREVLAALPEAGADETLERALAARVARADALLLDGGAWLDWWRRLLPGKRPGTLLRAIAEAQARGTLVCARGEAARFAGGGLVLPDEVGREMKNKLAQQRAWIVPGHLLATPLCVEFEDAAGRGAGRVLDAVARELLVAGTRELERAFVVAHDGALLVDDEARALLALDRAALRLGFEHLRKQGADRLDQLALDVVAAAKPDAELLASARAARWQAWTRPAPAPGAAEAPAAETTDMALATLLLALETGAAARHADSRGELRHAAGSRAACWTRRDDR